MEFIKIHTETDELNRVQNNISDSIQQLSNKLDEYIAKSERNAKTIRRIRREMRDGQNQNS